MSSGPAAPRSIEVDSGRCVPDMDSDDDDVVTDSSNNNGATHRFPAEAFARAREFTATPKTTHHVQIEWVGRVKLRPREHGRGAHTI